MSDTTDIRVYIIQNGKVIDFFDTKDREVTEKVRQDCDIFMKMAIAAGKAEKGYYLVEVVELQDLFTLDSEDLIA